MNIIVRMAAALAIMSILLASKQAMAQENGSLWGTIVIAELRGDLTYAVVWNREFGLKALIDAKKLCDERAETSNPEVSDCGLEEERARDIYAMFSTSANRALVFVRTDKMRQEEWNLGGYAARRCGGTFHDQ